jgi:small multidrug resistance pump
MPWLLVALAVAAEVTGTLSLKASDGFSRLWPSVVVVVGYATAFTLLAFALKSLGVGPVYAVWSALGTAGAAIGGVLVFGDRLPPVSIAGIVVVIIGVVLVSVGESVQ